MFWAERCAEQWRDDKKYNFTNFTHSKLRERQASPEAMWNMKKLTLCSSFRVLRTSFHLEKGVHVSARKIILLIYRYFINSFLKAFCCVIMVKCKAVRGEIRKYLYTFSASFSGLSLKRFTTRRVTGCKQWQSQYLKLILYINIVNKTWFRMFPSTDLMEIVLRPMC